MTPTDPPAPAPDPTDPPADPPTDPGRDAPSDPPAPTDPDAGAKAALVAERKARAEAEKQAKADRAELEKLRKAAMSEQEKAVAEAEERGRLAALTEAGTQLAAAKIEAALTGVVVDPAAVVEDLNLAKYLGEDGSVDVEAVAALREKYVAIAAPTGKPPVPGVPAGARPGDPGVKQLTRADLKSMSNAEIVEAHRKGQLDNVKAGRD